MAETYGGLVDAWKALRTLPGVSVREVACVNAARTLLCVEIGGAGKPLVCMASGVHGDERAAPWAMLSLVRDGLLDTRFAYRLWPCTNPSGYERNTRESADGVDINRTFSKGGSTPEARAIVTANRDRSFVLSIDLHEDLESDGYYFYEAEVGNLDLGDAALAALRDAGFPLQAFSPEFDLAYPPEAEKYYRTEPGRVITDLPALSQFFAGMTYSMFMQRRPALRTLTCESPARLPWNDRIAMHRTTVVAAIGALSHTLAAEHQ